MSLNTTDTVTPADETSTTPPSESPKAESMEVTSLSDNEGVEHNDDSAQQVLEREIVRILNTQNHAGVSELRQASIDKFPHNKFNWRASEFVENALQRALTNLTQRKLITARKAEALCGLTDKADSTFYGRVLKRGDLMAREENTIIKAVREIDDCLDGIRHVLRDVARGDHPYSQIELGLVLETTAAIRKKVRAIEDVASGAAERLAFAST